MFTPAPKPKSKQQVETLDNRIGFPHHITMKQYIWIKEFSKFISQDKQKSDAEIVKMTSKEASVYLGLVRQAALLAKGGSYAKSKPKEVSLHYQG